jgi:hypothetical protein
MIALYHHDTKIAKEKQQTQVLVHFPLTPRSLLSAWRSWRLGGSVQIQRFSLPARSLKECHDSGEPMGWLTA